MTASLRVTPAFSIPGLTTLLTLEISLDLGVL
jgi:hypothetical protein